MRGVFSKFHHVANFFISDCSNFELLSVVCESTTQECAECLFSCQCEEGKVLIVSSSFVSVKIQLVCHCPSSHSLSPWKCYVQGCHNVTPFIGDKLLWNPWECALQVVEFNDFIQWCVRCMEVGVSTGIWERSPIHILTFSWGLLTNNIME